MLMTYYKSEWLCKEIVRKTLKKEKDFHASSLVGINEKEKSILITEQWRIYWSFINTEASYQD